MSSPTDVGSGGGYSESKGSPGGSGGGSLHLIVAGTLALDGVITANGTAATSQGSGGGSGGAIWLSTGKLTGASADPSLSMSQLFGGQNIASMFNGRMPGMGAY